MTWDEVGHRCYRRRYLSFDLNIGVVIGSDGALLIDTRSSVPEARALRDDLRTLGDPEPRWVVNTHGHFDHCFGNLVFRTAALYGHPSVATLLRSTLAFEESRSYGVADVELVPPTHLVPSSTTIDLGDRTVSVHWLGRGHTAGDLVVVADDVVFTGDLVEESAPPSYGRDSFPLSWPSAVSRLLDLPASIFVPGHGDVTGRSFVSSQGRDLSVVASLIRSAFSSGLPVSEVLGAYTWPFPPEHLAQAVRLGYEHMATTSP